MEVAFRAENVPSEGRVSTWIKEGKWLPLCGVYHSTLVHPFPSPLLASPPRLRMFTKTNKMSFTNRQPSRQFEEGIKTLEEALTHNPKEAECAKLLATLRSDLDEHTRSLQVLAEAKEMAETASAAAAAAAAAGNEVKAPTRGSDSAVPMTATQAAVRLLEQQAKKKGHTARPLTEVSDGKKVYSQEDIDSEDR